MQFDSVHEYTFSDQGLYWHDYHEPTLILCNHVDGKHNRLMINGVTKDTVLKFAKKIIEESCELNKETADVTDKNVVT